jgi:formylglycine-generating enzyme required for sulfatase activity
MNVVRFFTVLLLASHSYFACASEKFIEPSMVNIPGGQLTVIPEVDKSKPETEGLAKTPKNVTVNAFRLGKYEVTVAEFAKFIAATNYITATNCQQMSNKKWFALTPGNWEKHNHLASEYEPVTCIGWNAAQAYVDWLSKETGKHYRLPSEAEWEYAAKAGTTTNYYWGDDDAQACSYANIADEAAEAAIKRDYDGLESKDHVGVVPCNDKSGYASVVGIYQPNPFGLYDMIGNINEFTQDCFNDDYPSNTSAARTDGDCSIRVIRGGSWHWAPFSSAKRSSWNVTFIGALEGFRIAEDISDKHACTDTSSKLCKKLDRKSDFERRLLKAQKAAKNISPHP